MKGNVLITGGTGLIGSRLTEILHKDGYQVSVLSRSKGNGPVKKFLWDPNKNFIEEEAIASADYIVNLAGAPVMDKKWSKDFKKEILESRTHTLELLTEKLKSGPQHLKAFISASAIGYYGTDTGTEWIDETSGPGDDFLAEVVKQWEAAANGIQSLNIRTVKLRIGIVLSEKGGALEKILSPIRMGAGAPIASGKQYISWIHMDDMCGIIRKAIEDESMHGVYNAVAPEPATNEELTYAAAEAAGKSIHLPHVPAFAIKLMLGAEKAASVVGGSKVSSEKIRQAGYNFLFPALKYALKDLIK